LVKVGDKVYHTYNGKLKGIVRELRQTKSRYHLDAGSSSGSLIALIEVAGADELVPVPVGDLMRDD
jgi:hypothetical protein